MKKHRRHKYLRKRLLEWAEARTQETNQDLLDALLDVAAEKLEELQSISYELINVVGTNLEVLLHKLRWWHDDMLSITRPLPTPDLDKAEDKTDKEAQKPQANPPAV